MKRFLRLLFNTLAAASLVFFLAGVAGSAFALFVRFSQFLKTGDFLVLGLAPPSVINLYQESEMAAIKLMVGGMVLPAIWFFDRRSAQRTKRRLASGHCPKCGYDLRATPDRCPECGTFPSKKEIIQTERCRPFTTFVQFDTTR